MQELITFLTNHAALSIAAIIIIIIVIVVEALRAKRTSLSVDPLRATQLINRDNAVVIDIRPQTAYQQGHIIGAHALTAQEMKDTPKKIEKFKTRPIIIVCNAGIESQKVAAMLIKQGYNAYSLAGGMRAWGEAKMPLVKE